SPAAAAQPQQPAQAPVAEQRQPALNNLLRGIFGR
ncbi:MAG: hypothetical protein JWR00_3010, partial [Rubritepida sp.]|nr:hypothetical protein [Rubritepida sp.]